MMISSSKRMLSNAEPAATKLLFLFRLPGVFGFAAPPTYSSTARAVDLAMPACSILSTPDCCLLVSLRETKGKLPSLFVLYLFCYLPVANVQCRGRKSEGVGVRSRNLKQSYHLSCPCTDVEVKLLRGLSNLTNLHHACC